MKENRGMKELMEELNVFSLQGLKDLQRRPDILGKIRFDVTPRMIMEPRLGPDARKLISGYVFYIETAEPPPSLMLMKIGREGVCSTVGKIEEIPRELVEKALAAPPDPPSNGMYAISGEIGDWVREALGL